MPKIVYNACYGGFSLSDRAVYRARELAQTDEQKKAWNDVNPQYGYIDGIERHDPILVQVVEELGEEADGSCAKLRIEELPEGSAYRIDEYDGRESVMTADDYDWIRV